MSKDESIGVSRDTQLSEWPDSPVADVRDEMGGALVSGKKVFDHEKDISSIGETGTGAMEQTVRKKKMMEEKQIESVGGEPMELENEVVMGGHLEEEEEEELLCSICLDPLPDSSLNVVRSTRQTQILATVDPCQHQYHDFCIKSWAERANTCPSCRCKFNSIVLRVNGEVLDKVSIQDKSFPVPEDDGQYIDYEDEYENDYDYNENVDPDYLPRRASSLLVSHSVCILCDQISSARTGLVICNSCSGSFHPRCLGLSQSETWNCPMCDSVQSGGSIVPPTSLARYPTRTVNSFITSLRDEIRTNRRATLGLPLESIGRRRRNLRSRGHTGMFLPPSISVPVSAPVETPKMSKEEADAWKLYDRATNTGGTSTRQSTPQPSTTISDKKVKKPIRKKHSLTPALNEQHSKHSTTSTVARPTTLNQILSTMKKNSHTNHIVHRSPIQEKPQLMSSNEKSTGSMSHSSHESSPSSTFSSFDEEYKLPEVPEVPEVPITEPQSSPSKLTSEALLLHESSLNGSGSSYSFLMPAKEKKRVKSDLSLSQKHLLQKIIVRSTLKPLYNSNKLDTDEYTIINKLVSRKLYKLVAQNELIDGDQQFINLLNKLIELRERFEYESYDDFCKRIFSDVYTTLQDRVKIDRYSKLVDESVKEELKTIRSHERRV